ncbi:MAG: HNH endonuclease [Alphaproteobacteria bacterium]|nr:HNH endonuclease [Alphaproteobacteria bacterium]
MLSNLKIKKIGAYCGILSIFFSNIAVAMQPEPGVLVIHGRKNLQIVGQPQSMPISSDIPNLPHEDFDVTAHLSEMPFPRGVRAWPSEKRKIEEQHLDTNIPYIEGPIPTIDYDSLRAVPFFIAKFLSGKIHPSKQAGAKDFFEKIIVPNQQTLSSEVSAIPDLDCLYYKTVSGSQHLFLRLSSATRREAEIFKQRSNGKTLFVESGELKLRSDGSMVLDHVDAEADKITVEAKDTIFNRASKMKAKWIIRLKAGKQRNETVINKWVRESSGKHHFAHAEGVESVDDCSFIAQEVIQEGDEVENYGIFVEADRFEDRAAHTLNMPAKITLVNYAWEEDEDMFSSASSSVRQVDDVLVPTRYHVNYYRSASDTGGSSVKFGYPIINSGSKIEVLKDTKEDIVVDEQHTIEIHEEKSGFSIYGGVSVPDPSSHLQRLRAMHKSGNMVGLSTATISAVAKGIQAYEDYKIAETLLNYKSAWNIEQTTALLQTLSHYVHGPSIQFGSRSVDMKQQTILTHGNTFISPTQIFHNPIRSSFAGTYLAKDMDIKTKTFITFDLPQTVHSEMSMHQSGISMDLLSFAIALINPAVGSALDAALSASSVTVGFQKGESHQTAHRLTILQAEHKLDIEAENGQLTQAQIKAGIIHAIFTNDLALKTLANEKWTRKRGGSMSFGLGGFADFKSLADTLQNTVASANISNIDAGSFEKIIDDFASMVGEEEFYLRVGNILRTESAFVGHKTHDPAHEHIEAKERQDIKVEECRESYDHSFDLSIGDLMTVVNTLKQQIKDEAIADGLTQEEAVQIAEQQKQKLIQDLNTEKAKVEETSDFVEQTGKDAVEEINAEISKSEAAKLANKQPVSKETRAIVAKHFKSAAHKLRAKKSKLNFEAPLHEDPVAQASRETQNQLIDAQLLVYDNMLSFLSTEQPRLRRSNSSDNLLQDTYIRQGMRFVGELTAPVTEVASEVLKPHDIPSDIQDNPDAIAEFGQGQLLASAIRGGLSLIGEALDWVGTHTRRFMRDDLGFSQRVAQNVGDGAELIAGFFGPSAVAKGVGSVRKVIGVSKASVQAQFQRNLYSKFNQAPYNPRTSQNLASRLLGADEFTRTTVPGQSMPNVRLAGQCKERIVGTDPFTFEPIIQRIVFDQRGFPIFDPYIKVETRISSPNLNLLSRKKHFQMATQNLYQDILSGKIDRNLFSQSEWLDIEHGRPKIGNYTWHHHQETGRMQLVPTDIHQWIGHIGGFEIWK